MARTKTDKWADCRDQDGNMEFVVSEEDPHQDPLGYNTGTRSSVFAKTAMAALEVAWGGPLPVYGNPRDGEVWAWDKNLHVGLRDRASKRELMVTAKWLGQGSELPAAPEVIAIPACDPPQDAPIRELVERMRCLELDHEPEGWPAVRMRDITALLDALGTSNSQVARLAGALEELARAVRHFQTPPINRGKRARLAAAVKDANADLFKS
jgi:hypothetical protein